MCAWQIQLRMIRTGKIYLFLAAIFAIGAATAFAGTSKNEPVSAQNLHLDNIVPTQTNGPVCIVGRRFYNTPSQAFAEARDGDRIEVQAGTYHDVGVLKANHVTVVGVNGRPRIDGQSKIADGHGLWVIYGNNTTLDNFEMLHEDNGKRGEAAWDQAAVYLVGNNLTLRHLYIHDNMQGFFNATRAGSSCELAIENSIFALNGDGGGHSHNIYVNHNITKLTMRGVWSRDCRGGHILKVRAFESDIQGCLFTDPHGISLNWFLDFPDGGRHKFAGNIVEHNNRSSGSVLIAYGEEGLLNPAPHEMLSAQNTFINDGNGTFFKIQHVKASLQENIFAGKNAPIEPGNQVVVKEVLSNPAEYNYRVAKPDQGATNFAVFMYESPANSVSRKDTSFGAYTPNFRPNNN